MVVARLIKIAFVLLLTVALAGTAYWGYQEHQDKNSVLIKAENNYQRAFHDLNNNLSNLEDELGKALAMNSRDLLAPCMANIWRLAYSAQSNLGQLPLTLTPFHKTDQFLAKIADFTYDIGMRDLAAEPLTDKEWKRLKNLHAQAHEVQKELRNLQSKVISQNLRWMDVELAVASENTELSKDILDGIETLNKQVEGYIETEWGAEEPKYTEIQSQKGKLIKGQEISKNEALKKVQAFLGLKGDLDAKVEEAGGREVETYKLRFDHPERDSTVTVDVSKKGGHILWFLDSRDIEQTEIGLYDAQQKALDFLEQRDITSMVAVESDQYDNVGIFDFVRVEDEIRIYPDLIRVKVALDNGDIIGYEALGYVLNHQADYHISEPKITLEEAKKNVNGNLKVMEEHLSVVELDAGEYQLCYELLGTIENETYRIFINAENGREEKVEKMKRAEPIV
ncbi:spore germination protein [Caldalkalibacillus uzonensis]|uniref:Spore germination protein n=1 Tax=Caldalkalibacillus uzonensis TaxID=353224 RepID=A0ABU0CMX7_9BACI|nr:germination protein YpeB [Caldalkalibacillus uzonensis]MDQ0337766.1 spore germination protein [Caldalkalibacillus uzonensis]